MRPGAALFAAALAASGAAFAILVLPPLRESADLAGRIDSADPARRRADARRWGGPPEAEVRRAVEAAAALRPAGAAAPRPPGLREEEPGSFRGRVRWTEVQDLFAWAASAGRPLETLEIRAREDDPDRAECRVVLGAGDGR